MVISVLLSAVSILWINILKQGLSIKSGSGTESDSKQKLMEPLSVDKAVKSEAHGSLARG